MSPNRLALSSLRKAALLAVLMTSAASLLACGGGAAAKKANQVPIGLSATDGNPYPVYFVGDRAFLILELEGEPTPKGQLETLPYSDTAVLQVQPVVGDAKQELTLIGPNKVCATAGTSFVTLKIVDSTTGSVAAEADAVALAGCAEAGHPALAFVGNLSPKDVEWLWPRLTGDEVDQADLRKHTSQYNRLMSSFRIKGVYDAQVVSIYVASPEELPKQSQFTQDLCAEIPGPTAWLKQKDKELAVIDIPLTMGTVRNKDRKYFVSSSDYGENIVAYQNQGGSVVKVMEVLLPTLYDVDCGDTAPKIQALAGKTLLGPYASIDGYCSELTKSRGEKTSCKEGGAVEVQAAGAMGGFEDLFAFTSADAYTASMNLGLLYKGQLFVLADIAPVTLKKGDEELTVKFANFRAEDVVSGGSQEVRFDIESKESFAGFDPNTSENINETKTTAELVVCGVGTSDRPSCLRIPTGFSKEVLAEGSADVLDQRGAKLKATFNAGKLTLDVNLESLTPAQKMLVEPMMGEHPVEFP